MPGSILAEWFLQPLLELILQLFGYWTGRIVVPVLSLGFVRVEAMPSDNNRKKRRAKPRWHGFHRSQDGGIVIDDDMTVLLGLLFWAVVGIAAYFVLR
jgi:hypothetical protein